MVHSRLCQAERQWAGLGRRLLASVILDGQDRRRLAGLEATLTPLVFVTTMAPAASAIVLRPLSAMIISIVVPRMPIVATGVSDLVGLVRQVATGPTEDADHRLDRDLLFETSGSKTILVSFRRLFSPISRLVPSLKMMRVALLGPVTTSSS